MISPVILSLLTVLCEISLHFTVSFTDGRSGLYTAIPFFLKRFGIKTVMLMSMVPGRCALASSPMAIRQQPDLFAAAVDDCLWLCIRFLQYFWSVFVEQEVDSSIRASAQGLF